MVRFQNNMAVNIAKFKVMVDDVHRFDVLEKPDFSGGWRLCSLASDWFEDFKTLCEIEQYIEEMDK